MGLLGISLLVASVVYVFIRPPAWMPPWYLQWRGFGGAIVDGRVQRTTDEETRLEDKEATKGKSAGEDVKDTKSHVRVIPPPPPPTIIPPTIEEPDDQTTPKATATEPAMPVPNFTLSESPSEEPKRSHTPAKSSMAPPPPVIRAPTNSCMAPPASFMPPPPAPGRLPLQPPRLQQFPAANSPQRAKGPVPNRSGSSSLGLAPPPTHSSVPKKPNRKVLLTPGHSPLDWARISGPNADLRGLPENASYMRVTPSMLKNQTGRKGKDAWMALNGKVYNVTPYAAFHPGGVPELMKGAARDGTRLFGEIHPWVNYETMLAACMVGLLVDEPESEMDQMD